MDTSPQLVLLEGWDQTAGGGDAGGRAWRGAGEGGIWRTGDENKHMHSHVGRRNIDEENEKPKTSRQNKN